MAGMYLAPSRVSAFMFDHQRDEYCNWLRFMQGSSDQLFVGYYTVNCEISFRPKHSIILC